MADLQKEFEYYLKHQDELVKKHRGKYVVIAGEDVFGVFDNELQAYEQASKQLKPGAFLIQPILPGEESYTQTFYSRVTF